MIYARILLVLLMAALAKNALAQEAAPASSPSSGVAPILEEVLSTGKNPTTPVKQKAPAPIKVNKNAWKSGSVMFEDKYVGWVKEAIKAHEKGVQLEILLPEVFPPQGQQDVVAPPTPEQQTPTEPVETVPVVEAPKEAPVFYLKSIMYFSPDHWTIWLNDQKISTGDTSETVDIVKVTPTQVYLVWKDTKIDFIYPSWKDAFMPLGSTKHLSNNKNLVIDTETGNVSFVLGHNQSFVTATMSFVEGRVNPTELGASKAESVEIKDDPNSSSGEIDSASDATKPKLIVPTGSDIMDNDHMQQYMNQLNMLQSVLGAAKKE